MNKLKEEFRKEWGVTGTRAVLPLSDGQVALVKLRRNKVLVRVYQKGDTIPYAEGERGVVSADDTL